MFLGFPGGSAGKESSCSVGDLGSIPGLGRSPGEGNCSPLQYSGLESSVGSIVPGVTESQTQLSDFHSHCLCILMCQVLGAARGIFTVARRLLSSCGAPDSTAAGVVCTGLGTLSHAGLSSQMFSCSVLSDS